MDVTDDLLVDGPAGAPAEAATPGPEGGAGGGASPRNGAPRTVILAHGAGAPMDSPFMARVAAGLVAAGLRVVRFEFAYMAARRKGQRRPPDREPALRKRWLDVIASVGGRQSVVIGGKSMGGRIASLVADEAGVSRVAGLVCLGYPFHPIGKPETPRTAHLAALRTPALFLQGTRDAMGTREDVAGYALSPAIRVQWLEGGDHSFKPPKASGRTEAQNVAEAIAAAAAFAKAL